LQLANREDVRPRRPPRARRLSAEPSLLERILALVLPLLVTAGLISLGMYLWPSQTTWLLGHATISFFALGKFIVLGGTVPGELFTPWELALLITYMDTLTGVLFVYNVDLFFRLPLIGPRLRKIRIRARRVLQVNPWLRRRSYLGVALFVMFPLTGTGAVGAAFLGKFMGLNRYGHLAAISAGGAMGGFSMAALAALLGREKANELLHQPWILGGMILALLALLFFLGKAFMRGTQPRQVKT